LLRKIPEMTKLPRIAVRIQPSKRGSSIEGFPVPLGRKGSAFCTSGRWSPEQLPTILAATRVIAAENQTTATVVVDQKGFFSGYGSRTNPDGNCLVFKKTGSLRVQQPLEISVAEMKKRKTNKLPPLQK